MRNTIYVIISLSLLVSCGKEETYRSADRCSLYASAGRPLAKSSMARTVTCRNQEGQGMAVVSKTVCPMDASGCKGGMAGFPNYDYDGKSVSFTDMRVSAMYAGMGYNPSKMYMDNEKFVYREDAGTRQSPWGSLACGLFRSENVYPAPASGSPVRYIACAPYNAAGVSDIHVGGDGELGMDILVPEYATDQTDLLFGYNDTGDNSIYFMHGLAAVRFVFYEKNKMMQFSIPSITECYISDVYRGCFYGFETEEAYDMNTFGSVILGRDLNIPYNMGTYRYGNPFDLNSDNLFFLPPQELGPSATLHVTFQTNKGPAIGTCCLYSEDDDNYLNAGTVTTFVIAFTAENFNPFVF